MGSNLPLKLCYVIDFTYFVVNCKYVLKTLAYCSLNTNEANRFTFKPMTKFKHLSKHNAKLVTYYENFIVNEKWSEGEYKYQELSDILSFITQEKPATFFLSSKQKVEFVKALSHSLTTCINIQDLCIKSSNSFIVSPVEFMLPRSVLQNVFNIRKYLTHNEFYYGTQRIVF